jgi:UDP-N-acetylmuramoyl-tripeptide--D-alanyl-D-alanine ligase
MIFYLISILWFFREIKAILFWLYLWQLKEYHIGRFLDHFRTSKGKKLFLNWLFIFKVILLFYAAILYLSQKMFSWQLYALWIFILIIFYFFESAKFLLDIFLKRIKKPVLTKKAILLIFSNLILTILFAFFLFKKINLFYWFSFGLLSFDILTPFIVSGIVRLFQPPTIYLRNKIIKRAKEKRKKFKNLIVIGITGSYGKTSTKEFLATILSEKYKVLKTKEHQNSEMGISLCILNELNQEHQVFVVEMGAYNRGGIKLLCDIAQPQIGILTGINEQHLATFGSLENIIKTKYELIESLPEMGFAVFNGDNKYCRHLYKKAQISKRICYTKFLASAHEVVMGDYWVKEIKIERESLSFRVFSRRWGEIGQIKANLLGGHCAQNILMAAIIAKEILGMTIEEIALACQKINPGQGGMKLLKGINGLNIIDSTYSANPDGVISHLEYLKIWQNKKVIIMPCLIELGSASKEVHRRIGQKIAEACDLAIITTKERFGDIQEGALEKGMPKEKILFLESHKKIIKKIKNFCQSGDVILLEGRVPIELIKKIVIDD